MAADPEKTFSFLSEQEALTRPMPLWERDGTSYAGRSSCRADLS